MDKGQETQKSYGSHSNANSTILHILYLAVHIEKKKASSTNA